MVSTTVNSGTVVFELVRFVDGVPVPYVPYSSDCGACCSAVPAVEAPRSCCSH